MNQIGQPPQFTGDMKDWSRRLTEYLIRLQSEREQLQAVALRHLIDGQDKAFQNGVLLFQPGNERVVFSQNGQWRRIPSSVMNETITGTLWTFNNDVTILGTLTADLTGNADTADLAYISEYATSDNRIINGNMITANRGEGPFTTSGVYTIDRWRKDHVGGTHTVTRQPVTLGDKIGDNNPAVYLRSVTASQTLSSHLAVLQQRMESCRTYADETVTVMGWARRSSVGNMFVEMIQSFGTGGSPSAEVQIPGGLVEIGTDWTPFAVQITLPSIAGKTIGSSFGDYTSVVFWQSAGSNLDSRLDSLGLFNGTLELWGIHILPGAHTTEQTLRYQERPRHIEVSDCERFYETGSGFMQGPGTGAISYSSSFKVRKRATPTVTLAISASGSFNNASLGQQGVNASAIGANGNTTASGGFVFFNWTADAEL